MHDTGFQRFPDADRERSVGARFDAIAAAHGARLAVSGSRVRFTYAELKSESDAIAHAVLSWAPAATPARVALLLDHDAPAAAALLGVLKAGHGAVIADPTDPVARIRRQLDDAEPAVVLTDADHVHLAVEAGMPLERCLLVEQARAVPPARTLPAVGPDALAAILYTSGSTGRPKGVMRNHRALLHGARNNINTFRIGPADRLTHLTRLSLGQGQNPIWAALLSGASLHMLDLKADGVDRLASWIDASGVTIYHSSIAVLRALHRTVAPGRQFPSVRVVRTGGEPMLVSDREIHGAHFTRGCRFVNVFSMTETSTLTMQVVDGALVCEGGRVPIGAPVPDVEVAIVAEDGREAAPGEEGEIVVRGRYLSSGYWRDPELTRQRFDFRPDGTCVIRTGDRGCRHADGRYEFAGRGDLRVKVRGYRVEVEEVQACLRAHPQVLDAVVASEDERGGISRLVAYITTRPGGTPSSDALRAHMLAHLPDHMVPSLFVPVPDIPLTKSGKIDRRALVESRRQLPAGERTEPRTPTEARLLAVWREVLGTDAFGIDDDFFVIGGDSLRAAHVLARTRVAFGAHVPFRQFLRHSTVGGMAALVDASLQTDSGHDDGIDAIRPRDRAKPAPLSFPQQQLWLVERVNPGTVAYNNSRAARLSGPLDVEALADALDALVARHAVLRTTYAFDGDEPVQVVASSAHVSVTRTDISCVPAESRDSELVRQLEEEVAAPFDLSRDVMLRARLVRVGDDDYGLVLVIHHIATDARSSEILRHELRELYRARVRRVDPALPPLQIDYTDFAAWQRARTTDAALQDDLDYWLTRLRDAPQAADLPAHVMGRDARPGAGAVRIDWPESLALALERIAREEGATLFMVTMAVFGVLLHRYTGRRDLVVGTPMSGRLRPETEPLVGFFANTVAIRLSTEGEPTFRELIRRVRDELLDAYEHQTLPFERLVEALAPYRHSAAAPLVDVVMGLRRAFGAEIELENLTAEPIELSGGDAKFALTVMLARVTQGLEGRATYDAARFERATIERMLGHFRRLLDECAADPDARVARARMLADDEEHRARVTWNDTTVEVPQGRVEDLFADHVRARPDHVAVTAGAASLTYRELDFRAQRLADTLVHAGVTPGRAIAVVSSRSPAFIVAVLAVLKCRCAYQPVDPADPVERVVSLMDATDAPVIVCAGPTRPDPAIGQGRVAVQVDDHGAVVDVDGAGAIERDVPSGMADAACVMFTSGSTGTPKGAVIPHAAIVRLVANTNYVRLSPEDVVAHVSSTTFDGSTFEIWGALLNGARLAIVSQMDVLDPRAFQEQLRRERVSVLFLPTALFNRIGHDAPDTLRTVRQVIVGGDVLDPAAASRVLRASASARLVNAYGPTETTTFATWYEVPRDVPPDRPIPIGRPIANTEVLILDDANRIVPIGVKGEIHIGGPGLALGYVGDSAHTAERFVPHPFSKGERLYRTGDLGSYAVDGTIHFQGRADDQIKIRGHRVHPAEVEAELRHLLSVREALVVPRRDTGRDAALIAYVVQHEGRESSAGALRSQLAARLPDYLVPETIVPLAAFPLTTRGKIDRAALPPPVHHLTEAGELPRDGIESRVADVWRAVLHVDHITRQNHFFELGGHSLTAVQVASRLDNDLGRAIPVRWLFESPTLEAFAARLDADAGPGDTGVRRLPLLAPRPSTHARTSPAWIAQSEAWARREQPGNLGRMTVRAFDVRGDVNADALGDALTAIVARHEALRTAIAEHDGVVMQSVEAPYRVPVSCHDLRRTPDANNAADRLFADETTAPFSFERGPWLRASTMLLPDGLTRVLLALPHFAYDGWSLDLIYDELETLYAAAVRGEPATLKRPVLQFADYVYWRASIGSAREDIELRYWAKRLGGLREPRLPMRRASVTRRLMREATRLRSVPGLRRAARAGVIARLGVMARGRTRRRSQHASLAHGRLPIVLEPDVVSALRAAAAAAGTTLFSALLTIFDAVLAHATDKDDVSVATFTTDRDRTDLEGIVGNLGNTLIVRSAIDRRERFVDAMRRVSGDVISARVHGATPIETVSERLTRPGELPLVYRVPVAFQLIQGLRRAPHFAGTTMVRERILGWHRSLRIAVTLHEHQDGVSGTCSFDPALYAEHGCRMLIDDFIAAAARAAVDPLQSVAAIGNWPNPLASERR
jgi:amino acid adenylation domain-containing protein